MTISEPIRPFDPVTNNVFILAVPGSEIGNSHATTQRRP
jgi:hypothetical protein